jgi:2-dehydropantoate 2-reductase
MDKRIAVIGAGAIGGYTGGQLAHNGFDVTLIDPWPEHVETIRRDGLALEGVTQEEFVLAKPKTLHLTEVQHFAKERCSTSPKRSRSTSRWSRSNPMTRNGRRG